MMNEQHARAFKVSLVVSVIAGLVLMIWDFRYITGLLLGEACYGLYLILLNRYVGSLLNSGDAGKGRVYMSYGFRVLILALAPLLAAIFPMYFNVFAAVAPIFLNKLLVVVMYGRKVRK